MYHVAKVIVFITSISIGRRILAAYILSKPFLNRPIELPQRLQIVQHFLFHEVSTQQLQYRSKQMLAIAQRLGMRGRGAHDNCQSLSRRPRRRPVSLARESGLGI